MDKKIEFFFDEHKTWMLVLETGCLLLKRYAKQKPVDVKSIKLCIKTLSKARKMIDTNFQDFLRYARLLQEPSEKVGL